MGIEYVDITKDEALRNPVTIIAMKGYYHSTSTKLMGDILEHGLCAVKTKKYKLMVEGAIWITTYPELSWADYTIDAIGGEPMYFIIRGSSIITSGCTAYPDCTVEQPVRNGEIVLGEVDTLMLLGCGTCIPVEDYRFFYKWR